MKKHNFSPGPGILPAEVIEQAAAGALDLNGSGLSILEMSHRGKAVMQIFEEAVSLMREVAGLPDDFEVLFCTGGASQQFAMAPMNLLNDDETAGYVDTGVWASKAIKEARLFGNVQVLGTSKPDNYNNIPRGWHIPDNLRYIHMTSNNTIYGTQQNWWPETTVPIVCDMSSDFLSRPIDFSKFGLVYAGAQKNIGAAGVTIVLVRKDMLGFVRRNIPSMFDYRSYIENDNMYNTPPVFAVYVSMLVLRWLRDRGGLVATDLYNQRKAAVLYDAVDKSSIFKGTTAKKDRSLMNPCFVMEDPTKEAEFLQFAQANGVMDIKGHRSVGGFRASMYNAMPIESVEFLVQLMAEFERTKA